MTRTNETVASRSAVMAEATVSGAAAGCTAVGAAVRCKRLLLDVARGDAALKPDLGEKWPKTSTVPCDYSYAVCLFSTSLARLLHRWCSFM